MNHLKKLLRLLSLVFLSSNTLFPQIANFDGAIKIGNNSSANTQDELSV